VRQEVQYLRHGMNAGCSQTVRAPANEYAIIPAVERKLWRLTNIARELEISQPMVLRVLHDDELHPYTTRGAHICFQTIVLYECNFANGYDINTLRMSSFYTKFYGETKHVLRARMCSASITAISGQGIVLILSSNAGIISA
jgi:hypothetical protein